MLISLFVFIARSAFLCVASSSTTVEYKLGSTEKVELWTVKRGPRLGIKDCFHGGLNDMNLQVQLVALNEVVFQFVR